MELTRTLEFVPALDEPAREIVVTIGEPEPDPKPGGDFRCRLVISGFEKTYDRYFFGVDPIQALIHALWQRRRGPPSSCRRREPACNECRIALQLGPGRVTDRSLDRPPIRGPPVLAPQARELVGHRLRQAHRWASTRG
jgi:hypothetical protein